MFQAVDRFVLMRDFSEHERTTSNLLNLLLCIISDSLQASKNRECITNDNVLYIEFWGSEIQFNLCVQAIESFR